MNATRIAPSRCLLYLFCLCLAAQPGCWFDTSGVAVSCDRYKCTVPILKCKTWNKDLKINLRPDSADPQGLCYQPQPGSTALNPQAGLQAGDKVYCDRPWRVKKVGLDKLKGALWIRPFYAMNTRSGAKGGVEFVVHNDVEGVYVAYDSRLPRPNWLQAPAYAEQTVDYAGPGQPISPDPAYITIEMYDVVTKKTEVKLRIYRSATVPQKNGNPFLVPTNLSGNPQLPPGLKPGDTAMYLVIIKPQQASDCSPAIAKQVDEAVYHNCGQEDPNDCAAVEQGAKGLADALLKKKYPSGHALGALSCKIRQKCPDGDAVRRTFGLELQPRAFLSNSEIEFNPSKYKSQVKIKIEGHQVTSKVTGTLYFEYEMDDLGRMWTMQVNDMILQADSINTDAGNFTDIVIALLTPIEASCQDASPPWATPCDAYQIARDRFVASVSANDGNGTTLVVAKNTNPIAIQIDHAARTFHIQGGPLATTLQINGEDTDMEVSIDLTGHFLNFAPQARADESTMLSECEENSNRYPIALDASASFDIYDTLPATAANYEWYEDYGLVTEKSWGTGKQVTIAPHQLSLGVHAMTLVVGDSHGIADMDRFDVEVRDSVAPGLTIPQDVIIFQLPPTIGPVQLDIGQATPDSDACCDEVMVSNDAPANSTFAPGVTQVTWRADDCAGNITTKVQEIAIIVLEDSIISMIKAGTIQLQKTTDKSQASMADCGGQPDCSIDLQPLVGVADELVELMSQMTPSGGEQEMHASILAKLDGARGALSEADAGLRASNDSDDEAVRADLRAAADENLTTASTLLSETIPLLDALPPAGGPAPEGDNGCCGIGTPGVIPFIVLGWGWMKLRVVRARRRR